MNLSSLYTKPGQVQLKGQIPGMGELTPTGSLLAILDRLHLSMARVNTTKAMLSTELMAFRVWPVHALETM